MAVSQVTPTLFLGGADASLNAALVSQKNITLIVNATLCHASPAYPGVACVRVPVADLPSARLGDHFDRVAERIHSNHAGGTLVHCAVGMSRSPALVMAYLMRYREVTLCQAHRWVQESRPFVRLNAGFWEQLLQYERRLYGKNTVRVAAARETSPPPQRTTRPLERTTRPPERTTRPPGRTTRPPERTTRPPERTTRPSERTTRPPERITRLPGRTTRPSLVPRSPVMSRPRVMTP